MTLLRPAALLAAVLLAGCAQMSGLGDVSLFGGGENAAQASPDAQAQPAVLTAAEIPPLPAHRPGKRPRSASQLAKAQTPESTGSVAPASTQEQPAKAESSGLSLAALFSPSSSPSASGPDAVLADQNPLAAYSLLAQRIKYCWLNPSAPRLPNHGFYSDLPAGEIKEARMVVYEKDPDGRRGTTVFKVDITGDSDGSVISSQNVKLSKDLEAGFKADLARWAKGDDRCKL